MATEEHTVVHPMEKPATRITSDVIEEVLLRLPISALLQSRRVCKQWCNIISGPGFIREHALRAPKHLLLFLPKVDVPGSLHPKILKPHRAMIIDEKWSPLKWDISYMDADDHLFASCNGLLCFYKTHTLKIANPVTGQCLHLSKPDGILLYDHHYLYSFGFHPITGEYKVVHFLREPQHYKSGRPFHFKSIQVYTLGQDKWRDIETPTPCCLVHLGIINVDGAMYWLTENEGTSCGMAVMSFDLREEMFVSIQLRPLEVKETNSCATPTVTYYITEIDNTVCIVTIPYRSYVPRWRCYNAELSGRVDIWALESRLEHKWSLKYSIQSPSVDHYVPQPCFVHWENIILHDRDGHAWYHALPGKDVQIERTGQVKILNFKPHSFYGTQCYFYKETLVPLDVYVRSGIVRPRP